MSRLYFACFGLLTAGLLVSMQTAQGVEGAYADGSLPPLDSTTSQIESLYQQVSFLQQQIHELNGGAYKGGDCCAECLSKECCCESSRSFYAGYQFVFIKPHMKESFQAVQIAATQNLVGFSSGYELTPRVWLGYESASGLGLVARYWNFNHANDPLVLNPFASAQNVTVIFPGVINALVPGEVLTIDSGLDVHTLDLIGTQNVRWGPLSGNLGLGLRYARLTQNLTATVTGGVNDQFLVFDREFEGLGPAVRADFERPLGGGLGVFGGFGGALMFGKKRMRRRLDDNGFDLTALPNITMDVDEVTGVGELEFGVQWTACRSWGTLDLRGGYEGQLWTDAGAPTLTFLGFEGFSVTIALTR